MLIAKKEGQSLIVASHQLKKADRYFCPACQQAVYLKKGAVMRPHFAHYQRDACDVFSEGETEEHLQGKLQLREWLERLNLQVEIEAYLPKLKQRPDLLVRKGEQKIAIEFQCSGLSIEKVVERTRGYQKAGYEVVWILGEKFAYKNKLTAFQKACLKQYKEELVLFHYSVEKKRLDYRFDFQLSQKQKMWCQKKSLQKDGLLRIHTEKRPRKKQRVNYEIEHQKMMRQFSGENLRPFQQQLYEKGESHISMPKEVYIRCSQEWIIRDQPLAWKMKFIWCLEEFPMRTVLTERKIKEWSTQLTYHTIPQMTEEQRLHPVFEFIEILTAAGVLKRFRFDKWTLIKYAKRYKGLEEKLK